MLQLPLYEFHRNLSARFTEVNGIQAVDHYGDPQQEHAALRGAVVVADLSFRGRLCLTGNDRQSFLNGQVTNEIKALQTGQGCYAAVVNHKGKMQGDVYAHNLAGEILLDFEPGYTGALKDRLEKFIIASDVQVLDVQPFYGLLSLQGAKARQVLEALASELSFQPPPQPFASRTLNDPQLGEVFIVNLSRLGLPGYDFFAPLKSLELLAARLLAVASQSGGMMCGWQALEIARIEAGVPRYGLDMDETNLPPEAGLETRAISYSKGCYTGQEVIARIRTYGNVARLLRGLRLDDWTAALPQKGDKLFHEGREAGYVTSAVRSPSLKAAIALGYVRREYNKPDTRLRLRAQSGEGTAIVVKLPFVDYRTP